MDEKMLEQKIVEMKPCFILIAKKYSSAFEAFGITFDDLYQECQIALWKSIKSFNGSPLYFYAYAKKAALNGVRRYIAHFINGKSTYTGNLRNSNVVRFESLDTMCKDGFDIAYSADFSSPEVMDFVSTITKEERETLALLFRGINSYRGSVKHGISRRRFDNDLASIRKKYVGYIAEDKGVVA